LGNYSDATLTVLVKKKKGSIRHRFLSALVV